VEDSSQILIRFNRLIRSLEEGSTRQTCFRPWEVEWLLDLEACHIDPSRRWKTLRRYQRVVQRDIERGREPLKISEYLARRRH
jgi:hypothetical protein